MASRRKHRLLVPAFLLSVSGQAVSLKAQDAPPAANPPVPQNPAPQRQDRFAILRQPVANIDDQGHSRGLSHPVAGPHRRQENHLCDCR